MVWGALRARNDVHANVETPPPRGRFHWDATVILVNRRPTGASGTENGGEPQWKRPTGTAIRRKYGNPR